MTSRSSLRLVVAVTAIAVGVSGCERDTDPLGLAPFPPDAAVFLDEFAPGVTYQAFSGSKVDALDVDKNEYYKGTASLKLTIPNPVDPSGGFAGGAFVNRYPRDLSGFNALTFWARSSTGATFNLGGIGNDNSGTSRFVATWNNIPISTTWTKYMIPIPDPAKLAEERGLFHFAEGTDFEVGYDVWIDELQYENVGTIAFEQPSIATQNVNTNVGSNLTVTGTQVTYDVAGRIQTINASPAYFTFSSSDESVAVVDESGTVRVVGEGTAVITATLGSVDADGAVTINASAPPEVTAPTPDRPAANVISLFSDAYTSVPVDTWSAGFDNADVADIQISGDNVKQYSNLGFAGIEFVSQQIDASGMSSIHFDLWTEDIGAFRFKLVDFGPDGAFGGGDDSEHEITLTGGGASASGVSGPSAAVPPIVTGAWNSVDIPLSDFVGLTNRQNLAQIIISGSSPTVYLDNIYFFNEIPTAPTEAAPTPTLPAANVISMFSNAYDDVPVDTWSTSWDQTDLADVQIAGNDTKLYTNFVVAGIEAKSPPVDASAMERFHMNVWTPDSATPPSSQFKVKLVDFGADGAFGGGDDVEHELVFDANTTPAVTQGTWSTIDLPLSDFVGLTTTSNIAQLILVGTGSLNTVYLDNVLFYRTSSSPAPVIDFEPGGVGADWTWSVFENADNPPLQFVANPDRSGANTSATVAMFTARQGGNPWAGTITPDKETFTLDASNAIVKVMVYKSVISDVGIKFEKSGGASTGEIKVANTVVNQWEELTFDFSGVIGSEANTDITSLVVFPDFQGGRTGDNVVYFDNISFSPVGGGE
jgi:hypothetical protein